MPTSQRLRYYPIPGSQDVDAPNWTGSQGYARLIADAVTEWGRHQVADVRYAEEQDSDGCARWCVEFTAGPRISACHVRVWHDSRALGWRLWSIDVDGEPHGPFEIDPTLPRYRTAHYLASEVNRIL